MGKRHKRFTGGSYTETTNNRMELKALIFALEQIGVGHRIDIYSDSEYVVKGFNGRAHRWNVGRSLKGRVNEDLWRRMLKAEERHDLGGSKVKVNWVRGHSGIEGNHVADRLANEGAFLSKSQKCKGHN